MDVDVNPPKPSRAAHLAKYAFSSTNQPTPENRRHGGRPENLSVMIAKQYAKGDNRSVIGDLMDIAKGIDPGWSRNQRLEALRLVAAYQYGKPVERSIIIQSEMDSVTAAQILEIAPGELVALARAARQASLQKAPPAPMALVADTQVPEVIDVTPTVHGNSTLPCTPQVPLAPLADTPPPDVDPQPKRTRTSGPGNNGVGGVAKRARGRKP